MGVFVVKPIDRFNFSPVVYGLDCERHVVMRIPRSPRDLQNLLRVPRACASRVVFCNAVRASCTHATVGKQNPEFPLTARANPAL